MQNLVTGTLHNGYNYSGREEDPPRVREWQKGTIKRMEMAQMEAPEKCVGDMERSAE